MHWHMLHYQLENILTPPPSYKMGANLQLLFLNAFSWLKMFEFRLNFSELYSQG